MKPWSRRRNPIDWSFANVSVPSLLTRGFTGHEHIEELALINMNGRMYDPILGMFLNPDNYVQSPTNSQSYNRYSYCINNPLIFTDPTGYTWLSRFQSWYSGIYGRTVGVREVGAFIVTLPATLPDALFNWDISRMDPTNKGTISNNMLRIYDGMFQGTFEQIVSRFTKERLQSDLGMGYAQLSNYLGRISDVEYYDGATISERYKSGGSAVTIGSFITADNEIVVDPKNSLFQHEYGHYLQSQAAGRLYLPLFAIPSLKSAMKDNGKGDWIHGHFWVEQDANIRAKAYFEAHIPGYNSWDNSDPYYGGNQILYNVEKVNGRDVYSEPTVLSLFSTFFINNNPNILR